MNVIRAFKRRRLFGAVTVVTLLLAGAQLQLALEPRGQRGGEGDGPAMFSSFPTGRRIPVELPRDERRASREQQLDQVRDWLLYAVVADAQLRPAEVRQALFDVPPVRRDYLRPVAAYRYGPTRYRALPNGEVAALVPESDEATRRALLACIADDVQKDIGKEPTAIIPFVYSFDSSGAAGLTRQTAIPRERLFSAEYGLTTATIDSVSALRRFLGSSTRLTSAILRDGRLELAGRNDALRTARPITVRDVADLWGSQRFVDRYMQRFEEFRTKWENAKYGTEEEKEELERQYKREARELFGPSERPVRIDGSGFSLDPAYDYDALAKLLRSLRADSDSVAMMAGNGITDATLEEAQQAVEREDVVPFLQIVNRLEASESPDALMLAQVLNVADGKVQHQAARYDGALRGTDVGMTLFYTDLLAKLWALDYERAAPTAAEVPDFHPLIRVTSSAVYRAEMAERNSTRLWFGLRAEGFQKFPDAVRFGSNSARVYAASSNPLQPGVEAEPNASSAAFLGWWDDHYETVAQFEPEYQRLDEIMKWSTVISWLSEQKELGKLDVLASVPPAEKYWFPNWARKQPNLRFRNWNEIDFTSVSSPHGEPVEALPLLYSESHRGHYLRGGVSLASREALEARKPFVVDDLPTLLRRADVEVGAGENAFRTLSKTSYEFAEATPRKATFTAVARKEAKFRSEALELGNQPLTVAIERRVKDLSAKATLGDTPVAQVRVSSKAGRIRIEVDEFDGGRAADLVDQLARSDTGDPFRWLTEHPEVGSTVRTGERDFFVRLNGSDRWMQLKPEGKARVDIDPSVSMRAGSTASDDGMRWTLAWVDQPKVDSSLEAGQYIAVQKSTSPIAGIRIDTTVRGPPPGATRFERNGIPAFRSGETIYVERKSLPVGKRLTDRNLRKMIADVDTDQAIGYAGTGRYREFLETVSDNPEGYKAALKKSVAEQRKAIDRAIVEGRPEDALQLQDMTDRLERPSSTQRLRRAVAMAMEERPADASRILRSTPLTTAERAEELQFVDRVLRNPSLSELQRADALRVAEFIDLSGSSARELAAVERNGRFDFEVTLTNPRRQVGVAGNAPVEYIRVDDPRASASTTVPRAGIDETFTIADPYLAMARPAAITVMEGTTRTRFELVTDTAVRVSNNAQRRYHTFNQRCADTSGEKDGGCSGTVRLRSRVASGGLRVVSK